MHFGWGAGAIESNRERFGSASGALREGFGRASGALAQCLWRACGAVREHFVCFRAPLSALWELFGSSQAQFRSSPGAVWEQFRISASCTFAAVGSSQEGQEILSTGQEWKVLSPGQEMTWKEEG